MASKITNQGEKKGLSKTALVFITALAGIGLGAFISYMFFTSESKFLEKTDGGIQFGAADTFVNQHRGRIGWRPKSHGVWYDTGRLKYYVQRINNIIATDSTKKPDGYTWRFGVVFGGAEKKTGAGKGNNRLIPMFMPILVKGDKGNACTIDFFEAKSYFDKKDSTSKPDCEDARTGHSYYYFYDKVFTPFIKRDKNFTDTCKTCIVFDEGNMFP